MAYVQNNDRNGKLQSGPLADYATEAMEAKQKDDKNKEEVLRRGHEQEGRTAQQKQKDEGGRAKVKEYQERKKQRRYAKKRNGMTGALGGGFGTSFRSGGTVKMSGTQEARIAKNEGGASAKG